MSSSLGFDSPVPYSPQYSPPLNPNSPWSHASHLASDPSEYETYESLTLPPINPDADSSFAQLPSYDFFAGLPPLGDPFLPEAAEPSTRAPPRETEREDEHSHSHSPSLSPHVSTSSSSQTRPQQQASQSRSIHSDSLEPFHTEDYLEAFNHFLDADVHSPTPAPAHMPHSRSATRRSSIVDLTASSPDSSRMAPTTRKRKAAEDPTSERAPRKAPRTGFSRDGGESSSSSRRTSLADVEVVDLAEIENEEEYRELAAKQQAELIKKQNEEESRRPVRLADFQCIICMDNPTDLTVTHCGHLFCSECLHQALHAGDKKSCPVCRTTISTTLNKGKMPKNGIFALEMKLVTATRKGKRAVR